MHMNRNHADASAVRRHWHMNWASVLGHLDPDKALHVPERPTMSHAQREIEG